MSPPFSSSVHSALQSSPSTYIVPVALALALAPCRPPPRARALPRGDEPDAPAGNPSP